MPTTIDTLQIQIQSSSANAAKGIDELATSLGKLKDNGAITTAVKNLNKLRDALRLYNNIPSNASKITSLATALSQLKQVGPVGGIGNSVAKLASSLKALDGVNVNNVGPQIKKIVEAVTPLSNVKAGGLGTMVNALSKIGKVTDDLDDAKITAFADRIEKLNTALEPLSKKMTTIQAGLKGINTSARSAGSGVQKMGDDIDASALNMSSLIQVAQAAIQTMQQLIQKMASFMNEAIEWDGIASRFGRGFGAQAQDTYDWIQRLNEEMGINVQQFMKYSSVYATMLTGFGVAVEDATKMALGYTELTYDIWAGYNDIYKTFDEAAEAVKSAIAGEVEPIRRAGFTIVESTLEQTAANHGLEISLYSATEAQKSYLRYLTLVDQAHAQGLVGAYAKELNTAEGLVRTLSQQLKSLVQTFGSLFLPILVKVIPYVQAFVELLTEAVQALAALFGIELMGVDWSGYGEGVGEVVDGNNEVADSASGAASAIKELKNATLGIDELNVISPPDPSGGGSGGSGDTGGTGWDDMDIDSLWDESIFADIQSQVDDIKEKFEGWLPVIETIGIALGALALVNLINSIGTSISQMNTLNKAIASIATVAIEAALVFHFADNYLEEGNLLDLLGQALVTAGAGYILFKGWGGAAGKGYQGAALAMWVAVAAQLAAITMNLADGGVEMDDPELWIQTAMTTVTGAAGGLFTFKGVKSIGAGKGAALGALLSISLSLAAITIGDVAADGEITGKNIWTALGSVVAAAGFGFVVGGGWGALIGAAAALVINIAGIIVAEVNAEKKKSFEEDMRERFGSIELSGTQIKLLVDKILPEWADDVVYAADFFNEIDSITDSLEEHLNASNVVVWKLAVGLELTEKDNDSYQTAIASFISTCQEYVDQRGYAIHIGLEASGASQSIIDSADEISSLASAEMERLGTQLQEAVNSAYEDGLLDINEAEAIKNIQSDMLEIQSALKTGEIMGELDTIALKWSGVELNHESFTAMMDELNDKIKNEIKPAIESMVNDNIGALKGNVAFAQIMYDKAETPEEKAKWADAITEAENALQEYLDSNPIDTLVAEVNFQAVELGLNTLEDLFAEELRKAREGKWADYDTNIELGIEFRPTLKFDEGDGDIYGNIELLVDDMKNAIELNISQLNSETREHMKKMYESMMPTMEDYNEIAEANRKAGKSVPQSIREGLNDYYEIGAIAGDVDAIHYTIGQGLASDPVALNTLATAEGYGEQITGSVRNGLLNNIDYVTDSATGLVIGIKNAVTGEVTAMTPYLEKNLSTMGVNLGDALGGEYQYVYDSTTGVLKAIQNSAGDAVWVNEDLKSKGVEVGTDLSDGLKQGVEENKPGLLNGVGRWASSVLGKAKEIFKIHSPSEATKEMGENLSKGLSNGMGINTIKDKLSKIWSTAKNWWDNSKGTMKTYTPSIGSIYEKAKVRWDNAREWWNNKKTKMKEYTPSIGSIYEKAKVRWDNAREWWNNKKASMKTYTPSIGNIKDTLVSAWNKAKSWWNNNVKLSIPSLGFRVTYTNQGLSSVKKAIVKALGLAGWPSLSFAANGGIFDQGSMIWAGERGPEIVANAAGGKTGVMNVHQMQDAVYEGVYSAVMAAMRASGGGGNQAVNVYIDGRKVAASVEKTQRERGAGVMGNQVYSYG